MRSASLPDTGIWVSGAARLHDQVQFRRVLTVPEAGLLQLKIAAVNDWVLYVDGGELGRGQYAEYPQHLSWTEFAIPLAAGKHAIAVWAYGAGFDFQTMLACSTPLLWIAGTLPDGSALAADSAWRCRRAPEALHDRTDWVNSQLGFTFGFDLRQRDDWMSPDYADQDWEIPVAVPLAGTPRPRPVPPMQMLPAVPGVPTASGTLFREPLQEGSYAEIMQRDQLDAPPPDANGRYWRFDFGCERFGILELELTADAGTVLDVAHAEHLTDGRVAARVGPRNFADRVIAGWKTPETYRLPRRLGGKWLEIHAVNGTVRSLTVRLLPLAMRHEPPRLPETADPEALLLMQAALRTLDHCMHDHYADCPWREQALYGGDSRWQMLYGYAAFGNFAYAAANLELLGDSVMANGLLNICAPCRRPLQIPSFSIHWLLALCEYIEASGDRTLWKKLQGARERVLQALLADRDEASGLYRTPCGKGLWNFYEWRGTLDGSKRPSGATDTGRPDERGELQSLWNLLLIELLAALHRITGDSRLAAEAEALRAACCRTFFDPAAHAFAFRCGEPDRYEFIQALALYTGTAPQTEREIMLRDLAGERYVPATLSSLYYTVAVLSEASEEYDAVIDRRLRRIFLPMLQNPCGTLWETELGAADFDNAGSLCHGWSAIPLWYYCRKFRNAAKR